MKQLGAIACIGKWGPALGRFSIYTVSEIHEQLPRIVDVIWASGLTMPHLDDFALEIELRSGDKRWLFKMMAEDVHLSWRQANSRAIPKDCEISACVVLGGNATIRTHMQLAVAVSPRSCLTGMNQKSSAEKFSRLAAEYSGRPALQSFNKTVNRLKLDTNKAAQFNSWTKLNLSASSID